MRPRERRHWLEDHTRTRRTSKHSGVFSFSLVFGLLILDQCCTSARRRGGIRPRAMRRSCDAEFPRQNVGHNTLSLPAKLKVAGSIGSC